MRYSLIILSLNAEKQLGQLIPSIKKQSVLPIEVIVIDSSSIDMTRKICSMNGYRVVKIEKSEFDHGGTRSLGAKMASCEFLVYLTQDTILKDKNSIKELIEPLKRSSLIGAAYGRQIPHHDASFFAKFLRKNNYPNETSMRTANNAHNYELKSISDSFVVYRKSVLKEIGYFKNGMLVGEDIFMAKKILEAGYQLLYTANAVVFHSHNYTSIEEFRRYFDIGVSHSLERDIFAYFKRPEKEGLLYVRNELYEIIRQRKYLLLLFSIYRNILKILGYYLGKMYKYLPKPVCKYFSKQPMWWDKEPK